MLACLALVACSTATKRAEDANGNLSPAQSAQATPAPATSAAPASPPVEPLKIPESVASGAVTESRGTWNKVVQSITYESSADNTRQPMMFYKPPRDEPRPLLVALHSWSANYRQRESVIYLEWCIANDWVFIHPNFRGTNTKPQAMGSELVIGDVLSAIEYAKANARVDESRIYAVGWSGGGYLGLLLAGRQPEIWAGVSAWVPISDLNAWYAEKRRMGTKYFRQIAAACGGSPTGEGAAASECRKRSALTSLERARDVPIDLNHSIRDGHGGGDSVPVSQSLRAFNLLAAPEDRLTEEEVEYFTREAEVPPALRSETTDPLYGGLKVLFRRQSGRTRVTVFDGAHDKKHRSGFQMVESTEEKQMKALSFPSASEPRGFIKMLIVASVF